jgi:uncharacterized membrane protein YoaK (UPF0700 family)
MAPRPEDRFASYDELIRAIELASVSHSRPAGFWVRGIAAGIDTVLVLFTLGVVQGAITWISGYEVRAVVPFFAIAAVYSLAALRRWGQTAGKALFELEVIDVTTGQRPSWKQSLLRMLVMLGPPSALSWAFALLVQLHANVPNDMPPIVATLWLGLCVVMLMHASARVHAKRAPWDRVAGTMVRYRAPRTREPV